MRTVSHQTINQQHRLLSTLDLIDTCVSETGGGSTGRGEEEQPKPAINSTRFSFQQRARP